jgi:hypothetical protein
MPGKLIERRGEAASIDHHAKLTQSLQQSASQHNKAVHRREPRESYARKALFSEPSIPANGGVKTTACKAVALVTGCKPCSGQRATQKIEYVMLRAWFERSSIHSPVQRRRSGILGEHLAIQTSGCSVRVEPPVLKSYCVSGY